MPAAFQTRPSFAFNAAERTSHAESYGLFCLMPRLRGPQKPAFLSVKICFPTAAARRFASRRPSLRVSPPPSRA